MITIRKVNDTAEAAITASARTANALSRLSKRIDIIEERLKAFEDAINDTENQKLRAEKDYIEGMYNILNYDVSMAKKPKERIRNE